MGKGFDDYKNGLFLGALLGVLVLFTAKNLSWLSFIDSIINTLTNWLSSQSWMPSIISNLSWLDYIISSLIGGIIGVYIDKK